MEPVTFHSAREGGLLCHKGYTLLKRISDGAVSLSGSDESRTLCRVGDVNCD